MVAEAPLQQSPGASRKLRKEPPSELASGEARGAVARRQAGGGPPRGGASRICAATASRRCSIRGSSTPSTRTTTSAATGAGFQLMLREDQGGSRPRGAAEHYHRPLCTTSVERPAGSGFRIGFERGGSAG